MTLPFRGRRWRGDDDGEEAAAVVVYGGGGGSGMVTAVLWRVVAWRWRVGGGDEGDATVGMVVGGDGDGGSGGWCVAAVVMWVVMVAAGGGGLDDAVKVVTGFVLIYWLLLHVRMKEAKKAEKKQSNRESAHRSRLRKQILSHRVLGYSKFVKLFCHDTLLYILPKCLIEFSRGLASGYARVVGRGARCGITPSRLYAQADCGSQGGTLGEVEGLVALALEERIGVLGTRRTALMNYRCRAHRTGLRHDL
ncbi:hypothetical protein Tco_0974024 [Tanacetum coccineum]|uniref:BZIP domain-containing protein n=1 Tax=Tanacetum coccineum TaxID=301880 RepID=A0ABQ5EAI7_9ASTR